MADVITRLKVDSAEYDAKIERARRGMLRLEESLKGAGKTFADADKDQVAFARGLGNMQTVAQTARGKVAELTKAYTDLSIQYKGMTDAEKKSPFGQALAKSLDTLKGRINESKTQLNDVNKELGNTSTASTGAANAISELAGKFGLNVKQLGLMGAALAAGKVALDVAKDAFFASEAAVDEWGRTMEAGTSLYQGFLTSLNTGDVSGFLSRIDEIVMAARRAYDELDRLGTLKTIQSPRVTAQQAENDRMRMMIQTRRYIAPLDGRAPSMKDGQLLTPKQIKEIEEKLTNGVKSLTNLIKKEIEQTTRAIEAFYERQAKELGMSVAEFKAGTSNMAEFEARVSGGHQYQQYEARRKSLLESAKSGRNLTAEEAAFVQSANPYAQYKGWDVFRVDGDRYNELVRLIQQRDQQMSQAYGMQSQAYRVINRAEGITSRVGGGSSAGAGKSVSGGIKGLKDYDEATVHTTESMKELQEQLAHFRSAMASATNTIEYGTAKAGMERTQQAIDVQPYAISMGISTEAMIAIQDSMKKGMEEAWANLKGTGLYPESSEDTTTTTTDSDSGNEKKKTTKSDDEEGTLSDTAGKITGGISSIVNGVEALGVKIPDGLKNVLSGMQAITSILGGIASIVTAIQAITTAQSFKFWSLGGVVHAAQGHFVQGNSYSGDLIPSALNAGELVLNKAQQGNLAAQLEGTGQAVATPGFVSGENIFIGTNNHLRRTGQGELVTTSMLRQLGVL